MISRYPILETEFTVYNEHGPYAGQIPLILSIGVLHPELFFPDLAFQKGPDPIEPVAYWLKTYF